MICISLSDEYVRFGQLIKTPEEYVIETIQKHPLSIPFRPENIGNPQLAESLQETFQYIQDSLPKPDSYVALTIPSIWFDLSVQEMDAGLSPENTEEALNWNITKRLGMVADQKFIQHYPLQNPGKLQESYLSVSYYKELGKLLLKASQAIGLNIHIMDINLLSAARAYEKMDNIDKSEKWAVWLVGEQIHSLIVIDSGEFRQLLRFEFSDLENYSIIHQTSADEIGEKVVAEINGIRTFETENLSVIDRLYFYSYEVDSEFFNMLLTYDIKNMKTLDPFERFVPVDLYEEEGNGIGAMCQFVDLMGLILRKMPGDQF